MENLIDILIEKMEPIANECLCLDPPCPDGNDAGATDFNNPKQHNEYCPINIYHFLRSIQTQQSAKV